MSTFEHKPDLGRLMATQSKKHEKAPDYWGEIAINLKDMTKIKVEDGLTIVKLSGWKRKSKTGQVYLSLAVDRYVPRGEEPQRHNDDDEDVPF